MVNFRFIGVIFIREDLKFSLVNTTLGTGLEVVRKELEAVRKKLEEIGQKIDDISDFEGPGKAPVTPRQGPAPKKIDLERIPEEQVVGLVVPFTHVDRIKILKELARENGKYFTEFLSEIGLSHSPLYFHLNILQKAGYVQQEYPRGRYLITELGARVLQVIAQLPGLSEKGHREGSSN